MLVQVALELTAESCVMLAVAGSRTTDPFRGQKRFARFRDFPHDRAREAGVGALV